MRWADAEDEADDGEVLGPRCEACSSKEEATPGLRSGPSTRNLRRRRAAAEARAAGLSAVAGKSEVARRDALNDLKAVLPELMAGSDQVRVFLARHLVSVEAMQQAKLTTKKQDTEKTKVKSTKKLKG